MKEQWCIPAKANAGFVYHMEDVLEVYRRPYDPMQPMVCVDEISKQPVSGRRQPLPAQPGQAQRYDYEYRHEGRVQSVHAL